MLSGRTGDEKKMKGKAAKRACNESKILKKMGSIRERMKSSPWREACEPRTNRGRQPRNPTLILILFFVS